MTSKRRRRTDRELRNAQASVQVAREAVEQVTDLDAELDVDPASALFFEFAAPLLMTARTELEFRVASGLAELIWAATHFDVHTQALVLDEFIQESGLPPENIPWLLEVYSELAARKVALVGG